MKNNLIVAFLIILAGFTIDVRAQGENTGFDKSSFYRIMQSKSAHEVDSALNSLKGVKIPEKDAYIGALTMKKAGLSGSPSKKLNTFKSGYRKLEAAIKKDTSNAEFRFLRLMIQENAPGFLGYKKDLKKDSEYVCHSYKELPGVVQEAISDYSKKSRVIKPGDF